MMGALAIVLLSSGYALFIRVVSKEVRLRTRFETEVTIARDIQQSLLPSRRYESSFAEASGLTVPATEVGGDFFDIAELPGPGLAAAIADVTGHGVGSGILSAMTKSALRSQLQHERDPAQVLQNLNGTIFQVTTEKMFVTFAYLLVDPSIGTVRYATAGHPPILLRSTITGEVHQLRTVNLGLGIKERVQFTSDEFPVTPGTAVLLYTDGILEAANRKGEQFGAERLTQAFLRAKGSPQEICAVIISEVRAFLDGSEQADDISLVCVLLKG
jgi:serine phosphatase RsbU (regulator of sigma subunit)